MNNLKDLSDTIEFNDKWEKEDISDRIKYLEDLLFKLGAMKKEPCFCCGYNGKEYFKASTHPCAERHYRLSEI